MLYHSESSSTELEPRPERSPVSHIFLGSWGLVRMPPHKRPGILLVTRLETTELSHPSMPFKTYMTESWVNGSKNASDGSNTDCHLCLQYYGKGWHKKCSSVVSIQTEATTVQFKRMLPHIPMVFSSLAATNWVSLNLGHW